MIEIKVRSPKSNYNLVINRKFTFIRGDSATGKTSLIKLLNNKDTDPTISVSCKKRIIVLNSDTWDFIVKSISDCIFFLDEDFKWFKDKEFTKKVLESNNYFVFINREDNEHFPYSYKEIYKFETSGTYILQKRMYESKNNSLCDITDFYEIITEDSNSGYQYFNQT